MLPLVLLAAGLHGEGVRRRPAPRLAGVAPLHEAAAAAAEAASPPGERLSSGLRDPAAPALA